MIGKNSTPPYQSKLVPYRRVVMTAWYRRKTLKEIQTMLRKEGVEITLSGIAKFIRRRKKKVDPHDLPPEFDCIAVKKRPLTSKAMKKLEQLMKRDPDEIKKEWFEKQYRQKHQCASPEND